MLLLLIAYPLLHIYMIRSVNNRGQTRYNYQININVLIYGEKSNLCCAKMVALCKGKSENEIFKVFGVDPEYFSTEKKDQIKATNGWVDDIFQ